MMKNKLCSVIILLLLCSTVTTVVSIKNENEIKSTYQPPIEWTKTYGGSKIDYGNCIEQTSDEGYVFVGAYNRNAYTPWRGDVYLVKTDSLGEEEWHQTYGVSYNENVGKTIQQTSDDGYIITGYTGYTYHIDGYVIKTDASGNLLWSKTYGGFDYYDSLLSGWETEDGGYIFTGWSQTYSAGSADVWLIKTDSNGNELWNKSYGGSDLDGGSYVQETTDGGFIVVGSTVSFGTNGYSDLWVIKTDGSGNEQWNKTFGGIDNEEAYCVQQTNDDGYIITGYTASYGAGNGDIWLLKLDESGDQMWNRTFGEGQFDTGNCVKQTSDEGYLVTGQYTDPISQIPDVYVIKTNENGVEQWSRIIDNNKTEDVGNYGIETTDHGYIVIGNTGIYQDEALDVWLIKFEGENNPPAAPTIDGPLKGKIKTVIQYNFTSTDPDNDDISEYIINWGDGTGNKTISGPFESGETAKATHTWTTKGDYVISAIAKDTNGAESPIGTLSITIPRVKTACIPFLNFLEDHPRIFSILQHLMSI